MSFLTWITDQAGIQSEPGPFGQRLTLPNPERIVDLDLREDQDQLVLHLIQVPDKGQGNGSLIMQLLHAYCQQTQKSLEVEEVENPAFFRKFEWLNDWDDSFSYDPSE